MSEKHLSVTELAEELGVSYDHAKNLVTKGHIPAVNAGTGSRHFWRVSRADFDTWLEAQRGETARRFGGAA